MSAFDELRDFLNQYRKGDLLSDPYSVPPKPSCLVNGTLPGEEADAERDVAKLRDTFESHGLCAPLPDNEDDRLKTIQRMGLTEALAIPTVQKAIDLAGRFIPEDSQCILALVRPESQQVLGGPADGPIHTGLEVPRDGGMCTHTILSRTGLDIPDATKDWRFADSPYVKSGMVQSYHGIPIRVRRGSDDSTASSDTDPEASVASFCVLSSTARPEGQSRYIEGPSRAALLDLADIVARELEAHSSRRQKSKEAKMRLTSAAFLDKTQRKGDIDVFAQLTAQICEVLDTTSASILDFRALEHSSTADFQKQMSYLAFENSESNQLDAEQQIRSCDAGDFERMITQLRESPTDHVFNTAKEVTSSPFALFAQGIAYTSLYVQPLLSPDGDLMLVLVTGSTKAYSHIEDADVVFLHHIGKIALETVLKERLQQADAAKTAFVARISHELRTPLHGLSSQVALIRDACANNNAVIEEIEEHLDTADVCAEALQTIVADVLDFSKSTAQAQPASINQYRQSIQLDKELQNLVQMSLQRQAAIDRVFGGESNSASRVQVFTEIQDLPEGAWRMDIDASGFKRIGLNLIYNSLKFTQRGNIVASLRLVEHGRACELSIKDTGCGMTKDFLTNGIFRPFTQADGFSQGSGLGLNIVESLAKRMNGSLTISSEVEVGTTVSFIFPISPVTDAGCGTMHQREMHVVVPRRRSSSSASTSSTFSSSPRTSTETTPAVSPTSETAPKILSPVVECPSPTLQSVAEPAQPEQLRVLVVDDNAVARKILSTVVRRTESLLQEAVDGIDAVEAFKNFRPHCVLSDHSMPNLCGREAALIMRRHEAEQQWSRSRIILVSANPKPDDLEPEIDEWQTKSRIDVKAVKTLIESMQANLGTAA